MRDQWIPVAKIQYLIQFEMFALLGILLPLAYIVYKGLLKKIS